MADLSRRRALQVAAAVASHLQQAVLDGDEAVAARQAQRERLAEVRAAVDAAFHAANRVGVVVPPTREICRSVAAARSGS